MVTTGGHCPYLRRQFLERAPRLLGQRLTQDLAMLGLGRTAMLGCPPVQAGDQLVIEITHDQLCHYAIRYR